MAQPFVEPCDRGIIDAEPCPRPLGREIAPSRRRFVLAACVLASAMAFIDGSALTVALPRLRAAFGADLAAVQWVLDGYVLAIGRAHAGWRRTRRRLRQGAHAGARLSRLRAGVGGLRLGAHARLADRVSHRAGDCGGDPDAVEPSADRRHLSQGRAQPRHRRMGGGFRAHHRRRSGVGRLADREFRLALGVRDQSAAGADRGGAAAARCAGRPARAPPLRSRRRGYPRRRARRVGLGAERDRAGRGRPWRRDRRRCAARIGCACRLRVVGSAEARIR